MAEEIQVSGISDRPFLLTIIDATQNVNGFEHQTTKDIAQALHDAHVPIAAGKPVFINSLSGLRSVVPADASVVLLFAHGYRPPNNPDTSTEVKVGSESLYWQLVGVSGLDLSNKLVLLCVCWGFNEDMVRALCESAVDASAVIAPAAALSKDEAIQFFPVVLRRLAQASPGQVDIEYARTVCQEENHWADGKMQFISSGETP